MDAIYFGLRLQVLFTYPYLPYLYLSHVQVTCLNGTCTLLVWPERRKAKLLRKRHQGEEIPKGICKSSALSSSSTQPRLKKVKAIILRLVKISKNLKTMKKDKYEALRWDEKTYLGDKSCDEPRFFMEIQQRVYEEIIISHDTKISPQKAIDFNYICQHRDQFVNIYETCERHGLVHIMSLQHDYNEEVMMQFFSALYLDVGDSSLFC